MNIIKKKAFNEKMGLKKRFPGHINMAKGGAVPVQKFGLGGAVSGLLGTNNDFQAGAAAVNNGTNNDQLNAAYNGVQNSLGQQQALSNQLQPQVGTAINNQNLLANQYAAMTQGQGPNPAQAALNQATGANVANQAALMAGQRGASANAGLLARQAAQQGAATQQQAVGQGATLQAQQQIAAQQNLANLANNQVSQAGSATGAYGAAEQNEQNILQNANTSANNSNVAMKSNENNVNAGVASGNQQMDANAAAGVGGLASNIPVIGSFFAKGGEVHPMADGGALTVQPSQQAGWAAPQFMPSQASGAPEVGGAPQMAETTDALSTLGHNHKPKMPGDVSAGQGSGTVMAGGAGDAMPQDAGAPMMAATGGRIASGPHHSHVANFLAAGGATEGGVRALVSPKEIYLAPDQVRKVVNEGADPMKIGHRFPGSDKVKGKDSRKNDVIPTTLQSGGVVIPVHITTHKQASERGRKFVARAAAKHMKRPAGAK